MDRQRTGSAIRRRTVAGGIGLLVAVGGAAFWWWREHAPLSRRYRRANGDGNGDGDRRESHPGPEREPGTDPV
ncbi:hypothetical protein [Halomarina litorea]|uniref:hypothetical protein n=1 Tax=Halomarina litorea TaxID=2961595 RepID=UPI0020C4B24F|nr:hypothetical protein [Halomarina sp. BCD28]